MSLTYPVVVANIRSRPRMRHDQVHADVTEVAAQAAGGIACWSEIAADAPDYRKQVADLDSLTSYMPEGADVPISWDPDRFRVADCGIDFGARAVPGIAPVRHSVWVLLDDLVMKGRRVGVVNAHLIPDGWNPKANIVLRSLRQLLWKRHAARLEKRTTWLAHRAHVVHVTGDVNRPAPWRSFPSVRRSSAPGVMFLGSRGPVNQGQPVRVPLNSDHDAQVVLMSPRIGGTVTPTPIKAPSPPYVGPAKFHGSDDNKPITRIVIHGTVSACEPGGARATAAYFRDTVTRPSSAHYVVDPDEDVQCVFDSVEAYHAPPNRGSLGIELCDPQTGSGARWHDENHQKMLKRAAKLVARLALAYGVPVVRLSVEDLKAGKHGICGHVDVSNAWHQTDHSDPGDGFPWDQFMTLVEAAAEKIKENHR